MRYCLCFGFLTFLSFAASADVVKVYEETACGANVQQVAERMLETGRSYRTGAAPAKSGRIFTHWTISTRQDFADRDDWGRAYDEAPFKLYEDTTLTAQYLPATQDEDGDGVADGHEIYWYGNLSQNAASDTDGDGLTFAEEVAGGTNPLMADSDIVGPVRYADGVLTLYNPNNYGTVTIRSDPEGALFATLSEVYRPGMKVATTTKGTFDPAKTSFAYWSFNGVRQADSWGRAVDSMGVVTDGSAMEIVAIVATDYETRMKLYWYGDASLAMTSDTDGDGLTFAQELAGGSNPLMADGDIEGPVKYADGEKLQYNPYDYQPYTLMSDPEGALFPTTNFYVRGGTKVSIGTQGSTFTYWKLNGIEQRDAWGRAMDSLSFRMPSEAVTVVAKSTDDYETRMKLYWYGTAVVEMTSDTDGDGASFADELARGTNPLMADADIEGPVRYADSELHEVNLQPYEQIQGMIIDDEYVELFHSPVVGNDAASKTFDGAVTPVVVDIDDNGRFDLVVESAGGDRTVYLNVGSAGNPQFTETSWDDAWLSRVTAAKVTGVEGLTLDVQPIGAIGYSIADVDGDGVQDLLVSDVDGRVWYYKGADEGKYVLQHKVWGGSFAGFAEGLRLAAVDWEGDGDLDCLCGTAEGKLMLLRDPKVGRPTNLRALTGVDNVKLDWDPNQQSRIRGYRVYRADEIEGEVKVEGEGEQWNLISSPSLPTYRDYPPEIADYDYTVSSISRHYVAGNSTPIISESPKTEAVRASLGKVKFFWSDAAAFVGDEVLVKLDIENSLNLSGNAMMFKIRYDATALQPVRIETSGLTEKAEIVDDVGDGEWMIRATGGEIAAGRGVFVSFVFTGLQAMTSEVALVSAALKSVGGAAVTPVMPETDALVEIRARQPDTPTDPCYVGPYGKWDMNGDGWLTWDDRQLMARLMQGGKNKKYTAEQLLAGDDNGNEELDNHDFQQMKADFDELGIKNNEADAGEVL